jgi:hypothetical protein
MLKKCGCNLLSAFPVKISSHASNGLSIITSAFSATFKSFGRQVFCNASFSHQIADNKKF